MVLPFWMIALSITATATGDATHPIRLVADPVDNGVRLRVVGESARPIEAVYTLEVSSDAAAGGNRSTQRGRASLDPGVAVTLMTLTMGDATQGNWTARLVVRPAGEPAYEEVQSTAAATSGR